MKMTYPKEWDDPRYQEAIKLFDAWDWGWGWGMPSDPHARENLRHAAGLLAAGTDRAEEFLDLVIGRYLGSKYQDSVRSEVMRIVRSAQRKEVS